MTKKKKKKKAVMPHLIVTRAPHGAISTIGRRARGPRACVSALRRPQRTLRASVRTVAAHREDAAPDLDVVGTTETTAGGVTSNIMPSLVKRAVPVAEKVVWTGVAPATTVPPAGPFKFQGHVVDRLPVFIDGQPVWTQPRKEEEEVAERVSSGEASTTSTTSTRSPAPEGPFMFQGQVVDRLPVFIDGQPVWTQP